MKAENRNEELILADFLRRALPEQVAAAEAAGKTPKGAMDYARAEAEKLPRSGNCVAVEDATVYAWTFRYFTDPAIPAADAPEEPKRVPAKKKTPQAPASADEPKKAAGDGQLDLFGDLA